MLTVNCKPQSAIKEPQWMSETLILLMRAYNFNKNKITSVILFLLKH